MSKPSVDKPCLSVICSAESVAAARTLRIELDDSLTVRLWTEAESSSGLFSEQSLFGLLETSDFAVFVVGEGEVLDIQSSSRLQQSRLNLIFELGLFVGRLGASRVFVVAPSMSSFRLPSDLVGLQLLTYSGFSNDDFRINAAAQHIKEVIKRSTVQMEPELLSCFISYSAHDSEFAMKLQTSLTTAGVRCWIDSKNLRIGDSLHDQIDSAIRIHDRLLLVLSASALQSTWIRYEVNRARDIERRRGCTFLFPIRIDDAILNSGDAEWRVLADSKHIGDFKQWRDTSQFNRAVSRLVKDLMISAAAGDRGRSNA
jgi:hypothetical protein